MKRFTHILTAVALALVFATSQAFAQNLRAGVKGGVDFANFSGDTEAAYGVSTDMKTGFSAGAFFGIDLHRYFRLQLDGQYVQKGAKATDEGVEVKTKVDYFEFMLPLTLLIPTESTVSPRLYAGPAFAFEASCKVETDVEPDPFAGDNDCGHESKSTDFGVFFGGGVDLAVGPGELTFDVLYNVGLTNIVEHAEVDPFIPADAELKNRNIQIVVGYAFLFGGM